MKIFITTGLILWVAAIGYGIVYLSRYETAPGAKPDSPPRKFPTVSRIEPEKTRATLIFFAHPKCPCSRASISELARLMPEVEGRLAVYIILSKPARSPVDWENTDLRSKAEMIPGVKLIVDENEIETDLFRVRTSGTGLLYDQDGDLRFQGGITRSRGMEGDSVGRSAIAALVNSNFSENTETAVYGCPLQNLPEDQLIR